MLLWLDSRRYMVLSHFCMYTVCNNISLKAKKYLTFVTNSIKTKAHTGGNYLLIQIEEIRKPMHVVILSSKGFMQAFFNKQGDLKLSCLNLINSSGI